MALKKTQSEPGDALAVTLPFTAGGEAQGAVIPSLSYRVSPRACTTQATCPAARSRGTVPAAVEGKEARVPRERGASRKASGQWLTTEWDVS